MKGINYNIFIGLCGAGVAQRREKDESDHHVGIGFPPDPCRRRNLRDPGKQADAQGPPEPLPGKPYCDWPADSPQAGQITAHGKSGPGWWGGVSLCTQSENTGKHEKKPLHFPGGRCPGKATGFFFVFCFTPFPGRSGLPRCGAALPAFPFRR